MIPIAPTIFWGPMAYAIMGGLAVATFLTLVFLPALYVAWFRISRPQAAVIETPAEAPSPALRRRPKEVLAAMAAVLTRLGGLVSGLHRLAQSLSGRRRPHAH
jgi:Cu/Ag efflux pump CusA